MKSQKKCWQALIDGKTLYNKVENHRVNVVGNQTLFRVTFSNYGQWEILEEPKHEYISPDDFDFYRDTRNGDVVIKLESSEQSIHWNRINKMKKVKLKSIKQLLEEGWEFCASGNLDKSGTPRGIAAAMLINFGTEIEIDENGMHNQWRYTSEMIEYEIEPEKGKELVAHYSDSGAVSFVTEGSESQKTYVESTVWHPLDMDKL